MDRNKQNGENETKESLQGCLGKKRMVNELQNLLILFLFFVQSLKIKCSVRQGSRCRKAADRQTKAADAERSY